MTPKRYVVCLEFHQVLGWVYVVRDTLATANMMYAGPDASVLAAERAEKLNEIDAAKR